MTNLYKYLIIIALCVTSINTNAQDIITKKDGTDISAKVLEVTTTVIKYKRFENQNGPVISVKKSDVLMVRYENGNKDIFSESVSDDNVSSSKKVNDKINVKPQYFNKCEMIIGDKIIVKTDTKGLNKNVVYYYQNDCQLEYQHMFKTLRTIDVCKENMDIAGKYRRRKMISSFAVKKERKYLNLAIEDYNNSLK